MIHVHESSLNFSDFLATSRSTASGLWPFTPHIPCPKGILSENRSQPNHKTAGFFSPFPQQALGLSPQIEHRSPARTFPETMIPIGKIILTSYHRPCELVAIKNAGRKIRSMIRSCNNRCGQMASVKRADSGVWTTATPSSCIDPRIAVCTSPCILTES